VIKDNEYDASSKLIHQNLNTSTMQYQNHQTPVANPPSAFEKSLQNHYTHPSSVDLDLKRAAKRFKVQHDDNVYSCLSA
jgi:hypothetical protein